VHDKLTSLEVPWHNITPGDHEIAQERRRRKQRNSGANFSLVSYRYKIKLYEKGRKMVKDKPWLEVDFEKALENGKFIHTIISKASRRALKNIEECGYWDVVKEGLNYIGLKNPAFLARSERSKYALAYMVAVKSKTGRYPSKEDVVRIFNISDTSYRRLRALVERLLA